MKNSHFYRPLQYVSSEPWTALLLSTEMNFLRPAKESEAEVFGKVWEGIRKLFRL